MPRYTIPLPTTDTLLARFDAAEKTVMRYEDLVEDDSMRARQALDELVLDGTVARFPVGDHIMVRDLREDPTREKGWPHADHVEVGSASASEESTDSGPHPLPESF